MPQFLPAVAAAFEAAGPTLATAATTAAVGYGVSRLTAPSTPHIGIPPPPGAAMISPAGQEAAADSRRRAAAAGGLQSTITGAAAAGGGPTSGGKSLLGQ